MLQFPRVQPIQTSIAPLAMMLSTSASSLTFSYTSADYCWSGGDSKAASVWMASAVALEEADEGQDQARDGEDGRDQIAHVLRGEQEAAKNERLHRSLKSQAEQNQRDAEQEKSE